jgi:hypothetical protein
MSQNTLARLHVTVASYQTARVQTYFQGVVEMVKLHQHPQIFLSALGRTPPPTF